MIFADADFYKNEYLLGRAETIPLDEFLFWSRKASTYINMKTSNRITKDNIIESVKLCTCEIAEAYFTENENRQSDNISSETTGGHSVSYADQRLDSDEFDGNIKPILFRWLANTGLLYRGN